MAHSLATPLELRLRWGSNLRNARLRAGVTGLELAELVGVSRMAVSNWENGRNAPSYEHRQAIARALGRKRIERLFPAA